MEKIIKSKGLIDTKKIGELLAKHAFRGEVITLSGDLGAGKTTLTKSIGEYLNVKEEINSPTFNILKCYFNARLPLYHIDAYRLEDIPSENKNIGLEEVIEGNGICIIEWPMFIKEFIDENEVLSIKITINENNERIFDISSNNKKFDDLFKEMEEF